MVAIVAPRKRRRPVLRPKRSGGSQGAESELLERGTARSQRSGAPASIAVRTVSPEGIARLARASASRSRR